MSALPTSNAAMARLCKKLVPDATLGGLGLVCVEGDEGKLSMRLDGPARWAYDFTAFGVDENDDPDDTTTSGHLRDRRHLALLLGETIGLRSAVTYADDPEAYLLDRARSRVAT